MEFVALATKKRGPVARYYTQELPLECPLFADIDQGVLALLLEDLGAHAKSYSKGEIIFLSGSKPVQFGVVLEGEIQLVRETVEGEQIVHDDLGKDATFGVSRAVAHTKSSPMSATAATDCRVLLIAASALDAESFGAKPYQVTFLKNLAYVLARKNVRANRRMSYHQTQNLRTKLCRYLHFYQKYSGSDTFTIPFNRNELASFLSVNRSALSRELSRMQEEGLIDFSKSTFTILGLLEIDC